MSTNQREQSRFLVMYGTLKAPIQEPLWTQDQIIGQAAAATSGWTATGGFTFSLQMYETSGIVLT
jgi:hypothetical protein